MKRLNKFQNDCTTNALLGTGIHGHMFNRFSEKKNGLLVSESISKKRILQEISNLFDSVLFPMTIFTYTHIYIYTYLHIHIFTYTHIYIYTYTYTHMYICMHLHMYVCTYLWIQEARFAGNIKSLPCSPVPSDNSKILTFICIYIYACMYACT
jgi:hypothetical protein